MIHGSEAHLADRKKLQRTVQNERPLEAEGGKTRKLLAKSGFLVARSPSFWGTARVWEADYLLVLFR